MQRPKEKKDKNMRSALRHPRRDNNNDNNINTNSSDPNHNAGRNPPGVIPINNNNSPRNSANSQQGDSHSPNRFSASRHEHSSDLISEETDDFIAKTESEVIQVPNCSYCNETQIDNKYYLCPCSNSDQGFEPICSACAIKCHKKHNPTLEVPGANICYCGMNNHIVPKEIRKQNNVCFFSKLFQYVANKGFYKYNNKNYCSVCEKYCLRTDEKFDQDKLQFIGEDKENNLNCECKKSHEINIIKLNADFISKKEYHLFLREVNFNIITKVKEGKQYYIDTLIKALKDYLSKNDEEEANFEFFSNIYNYKVLELFSMFSVYWENKYWYLIPAYFEKLDTNGKAGSHLENLIKLLPAKDKKNRLKEDMVSNYTSAKFYFAELLFNLIIRTYMNKYCNLWNVNCILNMDLYQRLIQIHHLKIYHFYSKNNQENNYYYRYLDELSSNILELFEDILKINERFPSIFSKIISYVFPTFNRIMKYLIKYNILLKDKVNKYFDLVYETLQMHKERRMGVSLKNSCFYILKSILYTLIYRNDLICYDYLQGGEQYEKNGFMFSINDDSEKVTKTLLLVMDGFDRMESAKNTFKFDYFVRKIFELLLNKNDFYLNSISNLDKSEVEFIANYPISFDFSSFDPNQTKQQIYEIAGRKIEDMKKKSIDPEYQEIIFEKFCYEINKINRTYFEFDYDQNSYFTQVNKIFNSLYEFIFKTKQFNMMEISQEFACDEKNISEGYLKELNKLKTAIFYSTFFQRLEEFFHIYTKSKCFPTEKETNEHELIEELKKNLENLLKFIFLLVVRDHKFLTLTMTFKASNFAKTFNDVFPWLEKFLERLIEMLYSPCHSSNMMSSSKIGSSLDLPKSSREGGGTVMSGDDIALGSNFSALYQEEEYASEGKMFKNEKYKYDNYFFLTEVISELIILNKSNLLILSNLMRISTKLLKLITIENSEYLDIAETFIKVFTDIKNNEEITKQIKSYFISLDSNANPLEKAQLRNQNEIATFLYSYFDFMCELYQSDVYFFDSNDMIKCEIIGQKQFESIFDILLSNRFENCPIEVEYALCRYYLTIKHPLNFTMSSIKTQLKNLYLQKINNNNDSLIDDRNNIGDFINNEEEVGENKTNLKNLFDNINIIHLSRKLLENRKIPKYKELLALVRKLTKIFEIFEMNKLKSYKDQKNYIFMYKYYENIIVRPLFSLFNLFNIEIEKINGKEVVVFYRAVFYFLKITHQFYEAPKPLPVKSDRKKMLLFYELIIKSTLDKAILNKIYNIGKEFSIEKKIFYFQLEKIFDNYITIIDLIINKKKSFDKDEDNISISKTSFVSETAKLKKLNKMNEYRALKEKLKEIYIDMKQTNYDDKLSLIQSYKDVKEELEYDSAIPIINYLVTKLFDPITNSNKEYIYNDIGEINNLVNIPVRTSQKFLYNSINFNDLNNINFNQNREVVNYKFQNAYTLIYLNCFFYNDSEDFQNAFSSKQTQIPNNFYDFLSIYIIVANVLNEVKKLYDLDYLGNEGNDQGEIITNMGRTESLSFSTGRYAIKFVQNLCEGHNREYQDKFFNLELDSQEFIDNNFCDMGGYKDESEDEDSKSKSINNGSSEIGESKSDFINKEDISKSRNEEDGMKRDSGKFPTRNKNKISDIMKSNYNLQDENNINIEKKAMISTHSPKKGTATSDQKGNTMTAGNEDVEAQEKERTLINLQVSFFNLVCYLMEIINWNLHVGVSLDCKLYSKIVKFKNYENVSELYTRLSDLIVEMIQGTNPQNFKKFYQGNIPKNFVCVSEDGVFNPKKKSFIFLELAYQIRNILFKKSLAFNELSHKMKYNLFFTINNLLSQEKVEEIIIRTFTALFPPEELLGIISLYLRGIYLSHFYRLAYDSESFKEQIKYLELNQVPLGDLKKYFKENPHIFHDDYFQLASQMFLLITILDEKYNVNEAEKISKYAKRTLTESRTVNSKIGEESEIGVGDYNYLRDNNDNEENEGGVARAMTKLTNFFTSVTLTNRMYKVKPNEHNYTNDKIVTVQFFKKVVRKCEFKIDNGDELELKTIYFICDPHYFYISKSNKVSFFKDVDRTSATIKLKSLLEILNTFYSEIEYKKEVYRKSKWKLYFLGMNFKMIDFCNFCISLLINIILVLFLKNETDVQSTRVLLVIRFFIILQILMNLFFIFLFYISKYGFYVLLLKNKLDKDPNKLSMTEKLNLYVLDSFLLNDEIYLMIVIIIMGICGVVTKYGAFLFALQLLSIVKFIDTIKEILLAFKIRFTQLLAILGFLAILIYFYASIGFYFLIDEFNIPPNENFCQTLLECIVNYFNHGVRAGGGIGDLLEEKNYTKETGLYFLRFFNDLIFYVTVVLLLLNMINGVIVTTFSQIREESNQKEEDQQNRCYICNIDRIEFQKNKIDFRDHQKYEHNINNYIKFFVYLKHIDEKDMDADQGFIHECMKENDIKFFPVNCAKSIGEVENTEGNGD